MYFSHWLPALAVFAFTAILASPDAVGGSVNRRASVDGNTGMGYNTYDNNGGPSVPYATFPDDTKNGKPQKPPKKPQQPASAENSIDGGSDDSFEPKPDSPKLNAGTWRIEPKPRPDNHGAYAGRPEVQAESGHNGPDTYPEFKPEAKEKPEHKPSGSYTGKPEVQVDPQQHASAHHEPDRYSPAPRPRAGTLHAEPKRSLDGGEEGLAARRLSEVLHGYLVARADLMEQLDYVNGGSV